LQSKIGSNFVYCLVEVQGYLMKKWFVRKWLRKIVEVVNLQRLITGFMLVIILILLSALFWQIANDDNCAAATLAKTNVAVGAGSHRNTDAATKETNNRFSVKGIEEISSEEEDEQSSANETAEENEDIGLDEDYDH